MLVLVAAEFEKCDQQEAFDIRMCASHMCTDCSLAWCTEKCQETQLAFPECRCEEWPEARKSFSGGEFAGKGKVGDAGDYAKGKGDESTRLKEIGRASCRERV